MTKTVLWRIIKKLGLSGYRSVLKAARYYVMIYDQNPMRGVEKKALVVKALRAFIREKLGIDVPEWLIAWFIEEAVARLRIQQGKL